MTNKSRRQRGSRTHGGGSHKNRRGAGHRGGRGRAGRDKHEFHNHEPLGKHGFSRPEKVKDDVRTINVQKLDEDAALLAADGVAKETDFGYRIDVRDIVEDGWEADAVKVLADGQVRNTLHVKADAFSASAVKQIESQGGKAIVSTDDESNSIPEFVSELHSKVEAGELLTPNERDRLLRSELNDDAADVAYETLLNHYEGTDKHHPNAVADLYRFVVFAREHDLDPRPIQNEIDEYFSDFEMSETVREFLTDGLPDSISPQELPELLEHRRELLETATTSTFGEEKAQKLEQSIEETQKEYLYLVRSRVLGEA